MTQPVYFECSQCGDCCSSISIPIEREKAERILAKLWVQDRLTETHRKLEKLSSEYYRLPLTDENTCVFLAEDKRCLIEVHEGRDTKPEECKRFPFAAVKTESGELSYDASASCKHIAEMLLTAFAPILPQPDSDLGLIPQEFPTRIETGYGRRTLSHPEFWHYQQTLTKIFLQDISAREALGQVRQLLGQQSAESVGDWRQKLLTLYLLRKPYGSWTWMQMLIQQKVVDSRIFGTRIEALNQPLQSADDRLLKGFLHNILRRYVLLSHGHSLSNMLGLACAGYTLVQWYAVTLEDTSLAIRIVERYYTGHHPYFLDRFRTTQLGWWCQKMLLG